MLHLLLATLEAGVPEILGSPRDGGRVEFIVRRPAIGEREELAEAQLDPVVGLVGDSWPVRPSRQTPDRSPHPDKQVTIMNSRSAALIAGSPVGVGGFGGVGGVDRRALAGDQLYVDLDLSVANLPPGTRLRLGSAVVEITDSLHAGCAKFSARYGVDAFRFVNSPIGRALRLRGVNTRVIEAGVVRRGDSVTKVAVPARVGLPATAEVGPPAAPEAGLPAAGVARQRSS